MTIQGETGGSGSQAIATRFPVIEGLTAATTKQTGLVLNLLPEVSKLTRREKEGL